MSGCILLLSYSHSPVFLVNSCLDLFSAPSLARRDPFSRSYRVSLPSSLTVIHPSASVYSTRPRVSVYGTGASRLEFSGFSRRYDYLRYRRAPEGLPYYRVSDLAVDLPAAIGSYALQPTIPSVGGSVTPASPRHTGRQYRNLDRFCHRPRLAAEP